MIHETRRNAVPEPTGEDAPPFELEVRQFFEVTVLEQVPWIALVHLHPAPNLRDEHAHVVIHSIAWSDVAGSAGEPRVTGEDCRDHRIVHVNHRPERIERPLRES